MKSPSHSWIGRKSRAAIGHASGPLARLLGGTSRVQATTKFLRRQLWAWPLITAVLFGIAGLWVHQRVEDALRDQRSDQMTTILDADIEALNIWTINQCETVQLVAQDEQLVPLVRQLLAISEDGTPDSRALIDSPAQSLLRERLATRLKLLDYSGFFVISPGGVLLAADQDPPIGQQLEGYRQDFFEKVLQGKPSVSHPYRSPLLLLDEHGQPRADLPTMFAGAAVIGETGEALAVLGLRIRPEDEFTRILQVARSGDTGETYVFDRKGLLLSGSRFDNDLKQIGLLVDQPDAESILAVELRDPGVDMTAGERPAQRRPDQPLTRMALAAVEGKDGVDADGYRDYRGVQVVGAWRWLPEYDFGIATEIDVAEAFRPVYLLRTAFWSLMGLLVLSAIAIFIAMLYMAHQQQVLQRVTLAARQLGQYALEEKLGSGGMGTVYRARHAMLRRPTAVKLLDVDKMSDIAITRFEREVQITSGLSHPHTIAIFDYGRTPEGIFYYAMEYLEGINLDDLVLKYGPLPEARAVSILKQACGSLAEAHSLGLIHRDVKPANIFLTCRGGLYDFVKVLDFGLVKPTSGGDYTNVTSANVISGTPLYLSPEAISAPDTIDARSDVYALGAVAYFLLTGTPVFTGSSIFDICNQHVQALPEAPSARSKRALSPDLEFLVLRCLAKSPERRPANAAALLELLEKCQVKGVWSRDDAVIWWQTRNPSKQGDAPDVAVRGTSPQSAHDATLVRNVAEDED